MTYDEKIDQAWAHVSEPRLSELRAELKAGRPAPLDLSEAFLDALADNAKGAIAGPWKCPEGQSFGEWHIRQDPREWLGMGYQAVGICRIPSDRKRTHYGEMFHATALHIASANPETVLAMIAEIKRLRATIAGDAPID